MMSRYVKPLLALLVLLGIGAFTAPTIAAPPAGLAWEVHGTGSGVVSVLVGGTSSGPAMPQHVGNATYLLTLASPLTFSGNGAGGLCATVTGTGGITAADGSTITWATVGLLCHEAGGGEGGAGSPVHYNGTYRITGGTGRFVGVAGGGSLTLTAPFNLTHFFKIDGTITGI